MIFIYHDSGQRPRFFHPNSIFTCKSERLRFRNLYTCIVVFCLLESCLCLCSHCCARSCAWCSLPCCRASLGGRRSRAGGWISCASHSMPMTLRPCAPSWGPRDLCSTLSTVFRRTPTLPTSFPSNVCL